MKVTIDGRTLDVAAGKTIIQAAHEAGIVVPYYCYHPGLVPDGNCRICLVEVEKAPKLMVACKTPVAEGMVVKTGGARVEEARRSVMEFLLINHPIDCPVCDQAGECKLQDYYYDYDLADSRFKESKNNKPKVQIFGEHVAFDGERCILCSRCVRFTRDVSETHELGIFQRGDHSVVGLAPGRTLDNPYSLNVVDICPVGALTSRDFRFRKRVWMLDETPSVCPGCSRGCATSLDHHRREDKIYRVRPRKNMQANGYWMCDAGRFMMGVAEQGRRSGHRVDGIGAAIEVAAARAAALLGAGRVGVLLSRWSSNEELLALRGLVQSLPGAIVALGEDRLAAAGEVVEDDFLIEADKNPNSAGARRLFGLKADDGMPALRQALAAGTVDTLLVVGNGAAKVLGVDVLKPAHVVHLSAHADDLGRPVDVELAGRVWAEKRGSFTSSAGVIAAFEPALRGPEGAADDLVIVAAVGKALKLTLPATAEAAFAQLAVELPELGGLDFAALRAATAASAALRTEAG